MENDIELEAQFLDAFNKASTLEHPIPPDLMLKLYAFYKQATNHSIKYKSFDSTNLVNAFKANAWFQVKSMTVTEAKIAYIELVKQILSEKG